MPRRFFTTTEKRKIVESIEAQKDSESLHSLCRYHKIQVKQLKQWKQAFQENPCPSRRSTAKSFHPGQPSTIQHLEQEILSWFEERTSVGLPTCINMVVVHLCKIDNEFRRKSKAAQTQSVRRVLLRHNIVYRKITHESQRPPQETALTASEFIHSVTYRIYTDYRDQDYIINMDETPMYF